MSVDDETKQSPAEKIKPPNFDSEAHMAQVAASLRPMRDNHWFKRKQHRDFMRAGWRRLIARQQEELRVALICLTSPPVTVVSLKTLSDDEKKDLDAKLTKARHQPVAISAPGDDLVTCGVCGVQFDRNARYYQAVAPAIPDRCMHCFEQHKL